MKFVLARARWPLKTARVTVLGFHARTKRRVRFAGAKSKFPSGRRWIALLFIPLLLLSAPVGGAQETVRLIVFADLHHGAIPNAGDRLKTIEAAAETANVHALINLGDFGTATWGLPGRVPRYSVIGNHDIDSKSRLDYCRKTGMPAPDYFVDIGRCRLVFLDVNGTNAAGKRILGTLSDKQTAWLKTVLTAKDKHFVLFAHSPMDGDKDEMVRFRHLLKEAKDAGAPIVGIFGGHDHVDRFKVRDGINLWCINSASYFWVAGGILADCYSPEERRAFRSIDSTAIYEDPLFAEVEIAPARRTVSIKGRKSRYIPAITKAISQIKTINIPANVAITDRQTAY